MVQAAYRVSKNERSHLMATVDPRGQRKSEKCPSYGVLAVSGGWHTADAAMAARGRTALAREQLLLPLRRQVATWRWC